MMLFADSVTMPSLKLNSKRKAQHSNGDHLPPPSKKAALHHAEIPHLCTDSPEQIAALLKSKEKSKRLILPNGVHVTKISGEILSDTSGLGKRKASRNAELALRRHYSEFGNVYLDKTKSEDQFYKNGHSSTASTSSLLCTTGRFNNTVTQQQHEQQQNTFEYFLDTKDVEKLPPRQTEGSSKPLSEGKIESKRTLACPSLKQPSLVLTDYKKNSRKCDVVGGVVSTDNYNRRMASLNESACVVAMIEPEKKFVNKAIRHPEVSRNAVAKKSPPTLPTDFKQGGECLFTDYSGMQKRSPSPYSCSSSSSEAESSYYSSSELEMTEPQVFSTLLALASLADESHSDDEIPYNCYGLLYNGDTIFPSARVFYASDNDFSLPRRIIPRVLPSREMCARAAASQVLDLKFVGKKKKAAKANNGWMTLGNPIKIIDFCQGSQHIVRKYYAGIQRNGGKEVICVRDCVTVRAGGDELEEKPYVAKIASIWRQAAGKLMMTVFWYYRPDEMDLVTSQNTTFQKDELLASQHHDDNSVACIEEKCHILGISQYCRYHAYIRAKKGRCCQQLKPVVPQLNSTQYKENSTNNTTARCRKAHLSEQPFCSHQPNTTTEAHPFLASEMPPMDSEIERFGSVEPELVYLCHRGYNHCAGKLSSRSICK